MTNTPAPAGLTARLARPAAIVFGVGGFLAVLGPFGTHGFGWPWVALYWIGLVGVGALVGYGAGELLPRLLPRAPEVLILALCAALISLPLTGAVVGIDLILGGGRAAPASLLLTYALVFVVSAFVTAVAWVARRLAQPPAPAAVLVAPADTSARAPGPALAERLPVRLRLAPVLSMTSEDHYWRVRTEAGEALILMRLSDAVAAMGGTEGARTHRSWWVAKAAVVEARKGDGRGVLILSDGTQAPVSRSHYSALRNQGWF